MHETPLYFHHSKIKLNIQIIVLFPIMISFYYLVYLGITERSLFGIVMFLFFAILFTCFWVAAILKIIRNQPYITVTTDYIRLDPATKSEMIVYYDQIDAIQISETSFQKIIEIVLYNEGEYFERLSRHNKTRLGPNIWFGYNTIIIGYKAVPKRERPQLLAVLDNIMISKEEQTKDSMPITDTSNKSEYSKKDFMKKYDTEPLPDFIINRTYFKKAYGYSFFIFLLMAIFPYYLMESGNGYLFYIIVSFLTFPFAKVLIDRMGVYKLRQKLNRQKGLIYYFEQMKFILDGLLFHISIFLAPLGLLFLLIRYIIKKQKDSV